jgi:hypothetical protein
MEDPGMATWRNAMVLAAALAAFGCDDDKSVSGGQGGDADVVDRGPGDNRPADGAVGGSDGGLQLPDRGVADDAGPQPGDGGPQPGDGGPQPGDGGPSPEDGGPSPEDGGPIADGGPGPDDGGPGPDDGGPGPDDGGPDEGDGGPGADDAALPPGDGGPPPDGAVQPGDRDGDGVTVAQGDCDDNDPLVFPGQAEICDGVDNDCDGTTDGLVVECYDGPDGTLGLGACLPGQSTCVDGAFGPCEGQALPADEVCGDGVDDDCDGVADDGCDGDGDGFTIDENDCDDGDPAINPGADEVCDGVDNDCDGVIDGVERPCYAGPDGTAGVGACVVGAEVCEAGLFGECEGQALPGDELCGNGVDDDCDGEVDEQCDLAACPDVDLDAPVEVSVDCLTATARGSVTVSAIVRDRDGNPIPDVDVQFTASPAVTLQPLVQRGTLYGQVARAPTRPGTVRFSASVGCTDGQRLALRATPTVEVVPAAPVSDTVQIGGCQGLDTNLRVRVYDAETGAPLENAFVMAGDAPRSDLQVRGVDGLQGLPGDQDNWKTTRADGTVLLLGHGGTLAGPQTVTAGAEGYENVTLVGVDAEDVVIPLRRVAPPRPATANLGGRLTDFDDLRRDNQADAGLVVGSFDLPFLSTLVIPRLLSRFDCWDPVTSGFAGGLVGPVAVPGNLYVPRQTESVFGVGVTVEEHRFRLSNVEHGVDNVVALAGKLPTGEVVDLLLNGGGDLSQMLELLEPRELGVLRDLNIAGDRNDLQIPLSSGLAANASCAARDVPGDAALVCVAAGDWSGGDGTGRLFPMGLATVGADVVDDARPGAANLPLTTVAPQGVFRDVGYLGVGVALYLDPDRTPAGQAGAVSAVLDRRSLGAAGGQLDLRGFFDTSALTRDDLTFSWEPVATAQSPAADLCRVEIVRTVRTTYSPGACSANRVETYELPVWSGYVTGDPGTLSLPTLPAAWPRAAQGGLVDTGATPEADGLTMRFTCMGLGLTPGFDFRAASFADLIDGLTHISSNSLPF